MAKVTKNIKRAAPMVVKSQSGAYAVGVVGVLGVLYLMSRESPSGETYIESITEKVSEGLADIVVETGGAVGEAVLEVPEKAVKKTQEKVSEDVFMGERRIHEGEAVTYKQFMEKKPIVTQTAVAMGDIITGTKAAQYGKYVSEETKKLPGAEERFAELSPLGKVLVGLGQAITVPFVSGGAAGLGMKFEQKFPRTAGFIS